MPLRAGEPAVREVVSEVRVAGHQLRLFARCCGEAGSQTPFVLVHGLGISGRYMVPLLQRLGVASTAWAPDLPGFGRSQDPPEVPGITGLAWALDAWMDQVGIERAILVGNSVGCQVVTRLAAGRPDRVAALALIAPTMDPSGGGKAGQMGRWLLTGMREPPSMVWLAARDYLQVGWRRTWRTFDLALRTPSSCLYPRVPCPALVIWGERDAIVSRQWAERVAALLPNGQLLVLPSAAHACHYQRPDEVAVALGALVSGLTVRS